MQGTYASPIVILLELSVNFHGLSLDIWLHPVKVKLKPSVIVAMTVASNWVNLLITDKELSVTRAGPVGWATAGQYFLFTCHWKEKADYCWLGVWNLSYMQTVMWVELFHMWSALEWYFQLPRTCMIFQMSINSPTVILFLKCEFGTD